MLSQITNQATESLSSSHLIKENAGEEKVLLCVLSTQ